MKPALLIPVLLVLAACVSQPKKTEIDFAQKRRAVVRGTYGTYAAPPRLENGRVNHERLLHELQEIHANTYHWLIWQGARDWDDLRDFLPRARKEKLKVWVTVVPPSESPPHTKRFSEPFQLDYVRWAQELARLSVEYPNLVAWSIDDFTHNGKVFTPDYLKQMTEASHSINPRLAFVPCCYFKQTTAAFLADRGKYLDGVLFPYRAESAGSNLKETQYLEREVSELRQRLGSDIPLILDIYATAHSTLGASTPGYVAELMQLGKKHCEGVLIYCHQNPKRAPEKYAVLKEGFSRLPRR